MSTYTIKSGDTLSQIAAKQGTTVTKLMAANPQIKDPNKIYAGASLTVPTTTTTKTTTPTVTPVVTTPKTPVYSSFTPENVNKVVTSFVNKAVPIETFKQPSSSGASRTFEVSTPQFTPAGGI